MAEEDKIDVEDKELLDNLARAEKARRAKALTTAAVIAALLAGLGVLAVVFSDTFFQPELDIAGGEKDVLAETNDPQCRGFIEKVTAIEADYRAIEADVEGLMKSDDADALRKLGARVGELRKRIDRQEEASQAANLRFDESRAELDAWFDYIDNELSLVQDLAAWRLEEIGADDADDAAASDERGDGDDGENAPEDAETDEPTEVVHVEAKPDERPTGAARIRASKKSPKELHEGSMLAVHEAFQSFRVWHTGSLHPCGKAEEGETPWAPGGKTASTKDVTKENG